MVIYLKITLSMSFFQIPPHTSDLVHLPPVLWRPAPPQPRCSSSLCELEQPACIVEEFLGATMACSLLSSMFTLLSGLLASSCVVPRQFSSSPSPPSTL